MKLTLEQAQDRLESQRSAVDPEEDPNLYGALSLAIHLMQREEYVEALNKACEVFDEIDGDEVPTNKQIWEVASAWGDLALWNFGNPRPVSEDRVED